MPKYDKSPVHPEGVLDSHRLLMDAFTWASTKEGSTYWNDVYRRLELLPFEYTKDVFPDPPLQVNTKIEIRSVEKLKTLIDFLFDHLIWDRTYEGYIYWQSVHNSLNEYLRQHIPDQSRVERIAFLTMLGMED